MVHPLALKLVYAVVLVVTLPLLLIALPIMVMAGHKGASERLSRLPGISPEGGLRSGFVLAGYHLFLLAFVAALITAGVLFLGDGELGGTEGDANGNGAADGGDDDTTDDENGGDDSNGQEELDPEATEVSIEAWGAQTGHMLWKGDILLKDATGEVIDEYTIADDPHEAFNESWEWWEDPQSDLRIRTDEYNEDYDRHEVTFTDLNPDETYTVTVVNGNGAWFNESVQVVPRDDDDVKIEVGYQIHDPTSSRYDDTRDVRDDDGNLVDGVSPTDLYDWGDGYRYRWFDNQSFDRSDAFIYYVGYGAESANGDRFHREGQGGIGVQGFHDELFIDGESWDWYERSRWDDEGWVHHEGGPENDRFMHLPGSGEMGASPVVARNHSYNKHFEFVEERTLNGSLINQTAQEVDEEAYLPYDDTVYEERYLPDTEEVDEKFDGLTVHVFRGGDSLTSEGGGEPLFSLDDPVAQVDDEYYFVDPESGYLVASCVPADDGDYWDECWEFYDFGQSEDFSRFQLGPRPSPNWGESR